MSQSELDRKIEQVKSQLDDLSRQVANASTSQHIAGLKTELDALKDAVAPSKSAAAYQGTVELVNAFSGSVSLINDAVEAGRRGDKIGIAASSLSSTSSLLKGISGAVMAALPISGAAAPIVAAIGVALYLFAGLVELASSILNIFRKVENTLLEDIRELLVRARAHELQDHLDNATDAFRIWAQLLEVGTLHHAPWTDLAKQFSLVDGNAVTFVREANHWLTLPDNQQVPDAWVAVFEAYVAAVNLQTTVYERAYGSSIRYRQRAPGSDAGAHDEDARAAMKVYFEHLREEFRKVHWLARRMVPTWVIGTQNLIYTAPVTFPGFRNTKDGQVIAPREGKLNWSDDGRSKLDDIVAVRRSFKVGAGEVLWGWNDLSGLLYYRVDGIWYTYKVPGEKFTSLDVGFYGDRPEPVPLNPDATPLPSSGVHVVLSLADRQSGRGDSVLIARFFVPEKQAEYAALPAVDGFKLPYSNVSGVNVKEPVRQARLHITEQWIYAYVLGGEGKQNQVYFAKGGNEFLLPVGEAFDGADARLYVSADAVWVMTATEIRKRKHFDREGGHEAAWEIVPAPPGMGDRKFVYIHPGDDGLLLAGVGDGGWAETYYGYTEEDGWRQASDRRGTTGWAVRRMSRLSLGTFPLFKANWDKAKDWQKVVDTREKLEAKAREEAAQAKPPA